MYTNVVAKYDSQLCILEERFIAMILPKNLPEMQETRFDYWLRKMPGRRDRLPTPVFMGFPSGSVGKEFTCNTGDLGSIPGLVRSSGGGHGNPPEYFAWRIPWTEEPGGLQSMGTQKSRT